MGETTEALGGPDGQLWRRVFGPLTDGYEALAEDLPGPVSLFAEDVPEPDRTPPGGTGGAG